MTILVVQSGDTVAAIARQYGISPQRLIADNGLERPGQLTPGQALLILQPAQVYTVRPGDSLFSIAQRFATTPSALLRNNPWLTAEPELLPGRVLTVRFTEEPQRPARINGYAYPNISRTLLRRELPFLSTLTIFGYGFTDSGELIPPDDEPLIRLAELFGVAPVLLLSSITETGNFSSERAGRLFSEPGLQNRVLDELVQVMHQKGYRGMDIDFEYVRPENADDFLAFIQNAARVMHENGFFVHVDLAPKTSAEQSGLLYEAHDYAAIGAEADTVLLMTYEWGYTYGPPMAVAPVDQVERVVRYAKTEIPTEKILLGVPNYGYDWTLPFQKGITRAVTIGNQYAIVLAGRHGVPVQYDETAQSPFFTYRSAGSEHVVWFEDVRSVQAKLRVASQNGLLGLGYWNLMRPFAQNWSLLNITFIPQRI